MINLKTHSQKTASEFLKNVLYYFKSYYLLRHNRSTEKSVEYTCNTDWLVNEHLHTCPQIEKQYIGPAFTAPPPSRRTFCWLRHNHCLVCVFTRRQGRMHPPTCLCSERALNGTVGHDRDVSASSRLAWCPWNPLLVADVSLVPSLSLLGTGRCVHMPHPSVWPTASFGDF